MLVSGMSSELPDVPPCNVYEWEGVEEGPAVRYEGCLECGACRIGCPYDNID